MARITKRDQFEAILGILDGEMARGEDVSDLSAFVVNEIVLLDKRANSPRKPTKMNEQLMSRVIGLLIDYQNELNERGYRGDSEADDAAEYVESVVYELVQELSRMKEAQDDN